VLFAFTRHTRDPHIAWTLEALVAGVVVDAGGSRSKAGIQSCLGHCQKAHPVTPNQKSIRGLIGQRPTEQHQAKGEARCRTPRSPCRDKTELAH